MPTITERALAATIDHAILKPELTRADVDAELDIAAEWKVFSVCVRPSDIPHAVERLAGTGVAVGTVIGFPHGAHATQIKVDEARLALDQGCEELDMVINIGEMIRGNEAYVQDEIKQICDLAHSRNAIVKVILETCYLTDAQKKRCCELSEAAGADFVKTSTGYGTKGCTIDDLKLMRASVSDHVRVKGSGGIRDLDTVLAARAAGASRCGVSATEKIMAEAEARYREGKL